jgi:Fe-S oxidoreductase/nitrate reductase gamma subunit
VTSEAISTPAPKVRTSRLLPGLRELLQHAVLQDRVLQRIYPGVMHAFIFWGMTIQVLGTIINLLQYPLFLPVELPFPQGNAYLGFELVMDIGGGLLIIGVLMALARRAFFRPAYLMNRWDDWFALGLLLLIGLLGFASEAVRLLAANPVWRAWSPIGNALANALHAAGVRIAPDAPLHAWLFWAHAAAGTLFVVALPFTKLRHMITGPLNILLRPQREKGELETIEDIENTEKLGVGEIAEFAGQQLLSFDACVQCGRCEDSCPASFSGIAYSPRSLIYQLQRASHELLMGENGRHGEQLLDGYIEKDSAWLCTTCGACIEVCPMFIDPVSAVIDIRRYLTLTTGEVPGSVGETLVQMERRGNPWGLPPEARAPWVKELGVRVLQPGERTDILLFGGCAYNFDNRNQTAARALVRTLQQAGVDFAVLGDAEACCGETARRLGHEYIFQVMAAENIATFGSVEFNRLVTPCAHCYNTLKNEYPAFGADFEVLHHTELLSELVTQGMLKAPGTVNGHRIAYHDSCYLGRYNNVYQAPRKVLDALPGMDRVEMERSRAQGFCCGGGGGQMWMETDPNTRINQRRLSQAVDDAGADVVVTACPYCLIMFDDAVRSKGLGEQVQVCDLAEVWADPPQKSGGEAG